MAAPAGQSPPAPAPASPAPVEVRVTPAVLRVAEYHAAIHRKVWRNLLLTLLVGPALYLLAMGVGVGTLIDDNPTSDLGVGYLEYVTPGLMAAAAMQTAMGQSLYPVLASVLWVKTAYGVSATPVRPADMAFGMQLWLGFLYLTGALAFLAMAALVGAVHSPLALLAPPVVALGGLAYSTGAAAWAIGREGEQSFQPLLRLGILPSFLLSGTFFPISQLPDPVAALAAVTPLWHSVSLVRGLTSGTIGLGPGLGHLAVLAAYTAVGLAAAGRAYRRRLHA